MAVVMVSGCSLFGTDEKKWKPLKPAVSGFVHTVTWADENLEIISRWYTGKSENAERLMESNPTLGPEEIIVGTQVFIPKDILITTQAMPRSHVDESRKKKTVHKSSPARKDREKKQPSPGTAKDDFQLFGPR